MRWTMKRLSIVFIFIVAAVLFVSNNTFTANSNSENVARGENSGRNAAVKGTRMDGAGGAGEGGGGGGGGSYRGVEGKTRAGGWQQPKSETLETKGTYSAGNGKRFESPKLATAAAATPDDTVAVRITNPDPPASEKMAYVAFLCNEGMLLPTLVLVRSVKATGTRADVVVMVTSGVPAHARAKIVAEGASIVDAPETPYPFKVTAGRAKMFKHCRYAKIHLWGLVSYGRIIYLDADTMLVRNIDNMFTMQLPYGPTLDESKGYSGSITGLLAVHDQFADIFNSGVMVLQPSRRAIDAMLKVYMTTKSYNIGDQGFLNVFWKENVAYLTGEYNYLTWLAGTTWGKTIYGQRAVMHYTAEVKPWNVLDWQSKEDPFYSKTYSAEIWHEWVVQGDAVGAEHHLTKPGFDYGSRNPVCVDSKTIKHYSRRSFSRKDTQLSIVLIATKPGSNPKALPLDSYLHRLAFSLVKEITVLWAHSEPPPTIAKKIGKTKLRLLKRKSPNAKFFPHRYDTSHVLVLDQQISISKIGISQLFDMSHDIPGRVLSPIVGGGSSANGDWRYTVRPQQNGFSLIDSSRLSIFRTDHLYMYTCILDTRLLQIVDKFGGCEDVLHNILASSVAEFPPGHVKLDIHDLEDSVYADERAERRLLCVAKFRDILNSETLNLRTGYGTLALKEGASMRA